MKYRAFGIELRHVAVDVEATSAEEAAKKALQLFEEGNCEESHSDEPWYDEDVEVVPYDDDDYDLDKAVILNGRKIGKE